MSRFFSETVPCSHCGQLSRQIVASSVNADRSPRLRDDILGERFHRFECPYCREWFFAEPRFVYIDVARRQWIAHHPWSWERRFRAHEADAERLYSEATRGPGVGAGVPDIFAGSRVRTVFGLAALREKILCFEAELDDAPLEALKIELLRSDDRLWFHPQGRPRLLGVSGDELRLVAAPPGGGNGELLEISVPRDAATTVAGHPGFGALLSELRSGSYVDAGRIMFGESDA